MKLHYSLKHPYIKKIFLILLISCFLYTGWLWYRSEIHWVPVVGKITSFDHELKPKKINSQSERRYGGSIGAYNCYLHNKIAYSYTFAGENYSGVDTYTEGGMIFACPHSKDLQANKSRDEYIQSFPHSGENIDLVVNSNKPTDSMTEIIYRHKYVLRILLTTIDPFLLIFYLIYLWVWRNKKQKG